MAKAFEIPESECPTCGEVLHASTSVGEEGLEPRPGDLSVCCYCLEISVFTDDLQLRPMTEADFDGLDHDDFVGLARAMGLASAMDFAR